MATREEGRHYSLYITSLCSVLLVEVFRSKVLEAHHYNNYGEGSDSTSSEDPQEVIEPKGPVPIMEPMDDLEEGSVDKAISILKQHKTFIRKQQAAVDHRRETTARLPRAVSSRGCDQDVAAAHLEGSSPTRNGKQRVISQADKNRKRKLKKRKAKEKHQKVDK